MFQKTKWRYEKMALSNLAGWNEKEVAAACGSACGAADK